MQDLDYGDAGQQKYLTGVKYFQIDHEEQLLNDQAVFVMLAPQPTGREGTFAFSNGCDVLPGVPPGKAGVAHEDGVDSDSDGA